MWLVIPRNREIPGSNLGPKPGCDVRKFSWLPSDFFQGIIDTVVKESKTQDKFWEKVEEGYTKSKHAFSLTSSENLDETLKLAL